MRIVILGGGSGDVGRDLTRMLLKDNTLITRITVTSRDPRVSKKFVNDLNDPRVTAVTLDVTDKKTLQQTIENHDLIVNTIGPFSKYGIPIMKAAIESKVNYVDICDDIDPILEALQLDTFAKDAGIFILTSMGWFPGMSNLRAKALANQMTQVDEIVTAWVTGKKSPEDVPSVGLGGIEHYIKALTGKISTYREGHRIKIPAHQRGVKLPFPEPLGNYTCYQIEHPETATLPYIIPHVTTASNLGSLYPPSRNRSVRFFTRLIDLKLFPAWLFIKISAMSMRTKRKTRLPRLTASYISCIGIKDKKKGELRYCEVNTAVTTAEATSQPLACVIFHIASGRKIRPGVHLPEHTFTIDEILSIGKQYNFAFATEAVTQTTWEEHIISLKNT